MQISFYFLSAGPDFIPLGEVWFFFHPCIKSKKLFLLFPSDLTLTQILCFIRDTIFFSAAGTGWGSLWSQDTQFLNRLKDALWRKVCQLPSTLGLCCCLCITLFWGFKQPVKAWVPLPWFPAFHTAPQLHTFPVGIASPLYLHFHVLEYRSAMSGIAHWFRLPFFFSSVDIICYISGARMSDCHPQTDVLLK